jgi:scyllo-inositol 2-dehydrogenase (NADP+)
LLFVADGIRTGVIGFGPAGQLFHTAVLNAVPGLELAAIVQRRGDQAATAYPGVTIYRDADQAIEDPQLQLIVVATPNDLHFDMGRRALQAGKHVVIDKPFTLTAADAAALAALAREKNLVLSAYQNRRWDGDFQTLQSLLSSGALGRILSFESDMDRWRPQRKPDAWRESGAPGSGILWDLGPHLIDQALVLFGLPEAVLADVRVEREGAVSVDAFDVRLYYPGVSVLLRSSYSAILPRARYRIYGNRGCYIKHGVDPQEDLLRAGQRFESQTWGTENPSDWGTLTLQEDGAVVAKLIETLPGDYRGYYANVRDAILGHAPIAVTANQAGRVIHLVELAIESSTRRAAIPCDFKIFND